MRLDQKHDNVCIRRPAPCRRDHGAVKASPRLKQAGRVNKDDLRVSFDRDAANACSRRLNLVGDDRDICPDHPVQQSRLAGIRLADQSHEACAFGHAWASFETACPHLCEFPCLRQCTSHCRVPPVDPDSRRDGEFKERQPRLHRARRSDVGAPCA